MNANAPISGYPHLRYLMETYFHQDWDLYGPTWKFVIRAFVKEECAVARLALGDMERILSLDPAEIAQVLESSATSYAPQPQEWHDWLLEVHSLLREELGG